MQKRTDKSAGKTFKSAGKDKSGEPEAKEESLDILVAWENALKNPETFAQNMLKFAEYSSTAMAQFLQRPDSSVSPFSTASEISEATKTMQDLAQLWMKNPTKFAESQLQLFHNYAEVWSNTLRRVAGEDVEPVAKPPLSDNRFKDEEWTRNPYFDYWKQVYLLSSNWADRMLEETEGLDEPQRAKAEFYMRLVTSAFSPTNFPATNPEVVRETLASNGENLVEGMKFFVSDMGKSDDLLKISQTDTDAFEVGRNLATTPGKVVFQNDLFQLIQYSPTTEQVREVPILFVPPWINKFYILDLTPPKSFVAYAVSQGFTVFMISWVNPDESLSEKSFEDYMIEGVLTAADAVSRETGVEKCGILGYCVGGTLVSSTLAYTAARGENPFVSATLFTTQVDFEHAGELLLFVTDEQLEGVNDLMKERGYLDGSRMASVFNMMRPRDLIWPYIVNNYMLGRKPFPFDLLFWNQDSTRMPRENHQFYLREFYNQNKLSRGELSLGGTPLSLEDIKLPVFNVATREDHIAPARSVYAGAKMFGGPVKFVLAGSGHIAGVINPPAKLKYQHWTGDLDIADNLDDWIKQAKETDGSWWGLWTEWMSERSGDWIPPRQPGTTLGTIEDAPGSFVKVKC
ncbi:MAG: PHA/PHB synthase family protein [Hyphomicrobiaceae bacterium]